MTTEAVTTGVPDAGPGPISPIRSASCRRPVLADTVVDRSSTVHRLVGLAAPTLVVLAAPAGYGKTITASQWDLADPRPFAWVNLDALDDDPAHLVAHIATALASRGLLDTEDLRFLSAPGRSTRTELVPAMLEILERSDPFVLVIDDVHMLRNPEAVAILTAVAEGKPNAGVLALLGRVAPPVAQPRRRLHDDLVEIGPNELALELDEARAVFVGLGVTVDDGLVTAVLDRCEGWAGGVHLSALALRDSPDPAASGPVTGRNRLLADYLVDEVLSGLDDETVTFLEEAAVLEEMSAPLLDEVLDRRDSGRRLTDIEASGNLFLIALDEDRRWYRYHHLFAELLVTRLLQRDPDRFRALHARASEHFEAEGDLDAAIHHSSAAGDRQRAAALVHRQAISLVFAGRPGVLARRLSMLDDVAIDTFADGAVAAAWAAVAEADIPRVRSAVAAALATRHEGPLADGSLSLPAALGLIAGMIGDGGLEGVLRSSGVVIDSGGPDVNPWWGMALTVRATALIQLGRHAEARADLLTAIGEMHTIPGFEAGAQLLLGWIHLREGDVVSASVHADAGRRIADRHELDHVVPLLVIYSTDAVIAARSGDRARARDGIAVANASLARLGGASPRTCVFGHQVLAEAEHALQNGTEARRHLDEAVRVLRRHPLSVALAEENDRLARLLARGPAGSSLAITPLTAAEQRILPLLATHLSLPQIADELHVSRNTVKTHCVSVYRKLGVSSRDDAVSECRRLGLIPT